MVAASVLFTVNCSWSDTPGLNWLGFTEAVQELILARTDVLCKIGISKLSNKTAAAADILLSISFSLHLNSLGNDKILL
jgi:hypothetical protein